MSLTQINRALEKVLPLLTPLSVLLGVLLGSHLAGYRELSPWIFAFMTFAGSLGSNFRQFVNVIAHPIPLIATLFVLHLAMPLLAWGTGHLIYGDDAYTMTGLILAAAIPTGIMSLVWVTILKGNTALTLSIILIDTVLSPLIVPFTLAAFVGAKVQVDAMAMMEGLLYMIVLPSLLGMLMNQLTKGRVKEVWGPRLNPLTKVGIVCVVTINSSVAAPYFRAFDWDLLGMAAVVLALAVCGYLLGWLASKLLRTDRGTAVSLTLNGGMRNISAGAVLAVTYFAPPVAVPVVLGMLFQQSLAAFFGFLLRREPKADAAPTPKETVRVM
ncbi:bile acid:sodium symporter family protein [Paenibacillus sp. TRM 82003]|nr:bile acid:sodium symporter family protein [Paenibacillus sp. TRM 82003]